MFRCLCQLQAGCIPKLGDAPELCLSQAWECQYLVKYIQEGHDNDQDCVRHCNPQQKPANRCIYLHWRKHFEEGP